MAYTEYIVANVVHCSLPAGRQVPLSYPGVLCYMLMNHCAVLRSAI
jgi:hypothetical protein